MDFGDQLEREQLGYPAFRHNLAEFDLPPATMRQAILGQLAVCSAEEVTALQAESIRDLVAAVKNRHVPGLPVNQEDIGAFLYVVVSSFSPSSYALTPSVFLTRALFWHSAIL